MVTMTLFTAIVLLIFINTILDHLLNWWFRIASNKNSEFSGVMLLIVYLVKTILVLYILSKIL